MRIHLGCELTFDLPNPTPMILMLNVHPSRAAGLERPDQIYTRPPVPIEPFQDGFGNWCGRVLAPAGEFQIRTDTIIEDDGATDPVAPSAEQHKVEDLPSDTLAFLLGSRYCETDVLSDDAWRLFGGLAPGWTRVQAIVDFVHHHIVFGYQFASSTQTAAQSYASAKGVCRDYAHLAIAFCRAMNIPARYCTGYISDIGLPPPYAPGDFAAWMEVYIGHRWYVFDPRNNAPRRGRVLMARGRDAADVSLTHSFGYNRLTHFKVITDEIVAPPAAPLAVDITSASGRVPPDTGVEQGPRPSQGEPAVHHDGLARHEPRVV